MLYAALADAERKSGHKVDLLICCGDFQALRNADDLHCFACPPKYRAMKDFHKYYSGEAVAPVPTIFGATPYVSLKLAALQAPAHTSTYVRTGIARIDDVN